MRSKTVIIMRKISFRNDKIYLQNKKKKDILIPFEEQTNKRTN